MVLWDEEGVKVGSQSQGESSVVEDGSCVMHGASVGSWVGSSVCDDSNIPVGSSLWVGEELSLDSEEVVVVEVVVEVDEDDEVVVRVE